MNKSQLLAIIKTAIETCPLMDVDSIANITVDGTEDDCEMIITDTSGQDWVVKVDEIQQ